MSDRHDHDGHAHHQLAGRSDLADHRVVRILRAITIACGVLIVIGIVVLWPTGEREADPLGLGADPLDAHVVDVLDRPCRGAEGQRCARVRFELRSGPDEGTIASLDQPVDTPIGVDDDIRVTAVERNQGARQYSFYDFERSTPLLVLIGLFVIAVLALGRWRGLGAIAGLVVSLTIIVGLALPSLVDGNDAVTVALVAAGAVAIPALYLAHGTGPATDVALLSTFFGLALTAALAWGFVQATKLTGLTDDASFVLQSLGPDIDARGVLLAGVVIGSLGVLDDVTVTQVSAVWELHRGRPTISRAELLASALRIGRDHISSTVNTLFLAYAGAALPLLLLFTGVGESVTGVATREIVATEVVRALVGSIGLVAAVPVSTGLAAYVVTTAAGPDLIPRRRAARRRDG